MHFRVGKGLVSKALDVPTELYFAGGLFVRRDGSRAGGLIDADLIFSRSIGLCARS